MNWATWQHFTCHWSNVETHTHMKQREWTVANTHVDCTSNCYRYTNKWPSVWDERHHSRLVAVSLFIEMMIISFLGLSEMRICNVCAPFVYHPYGDKSVGLRCDMHVACTRKCDCQAQEWIILLKSVLWKLSYLDCLGWLNWLRIGFSGWCIVLLVIIVCIPKQCINSYAVE